MSFPGGGRPSGVGRVDVAILITASTSSFVGIVHDDPVAVEEGAVLGLPSDVEPDEGDVESDPVLGEEECVPSTWGGLTGWRGPCIKANQHTHIGI